MKHISGRVVLITRTGSEIPSIRETINRGRDGELFNLLEIDKSGRRLRIIYGNSQYGSIPSIETHAHLVANSISISEGLDNPATVHAHPYHLIALGKHERIAGDKARFNAAIHTQVEGININYQEMIGVVPYYRSGSEDLVVNSLDSFQKHRFTLWMSHGVILRETSIRRGYTLLGYAEFSARAAIDSLNIGGIGLPYAEVRTLLEQNNLVKSYKDLFAKS